MGRQIHLAMDHGDEDLFHAYLRESAEVAIYRSWSPAPGLVSSFSQERDASQFWLHKRAFVWKPMFELVRYEDKTTGKPGAYYRLNGRNAPLIEYSRHALTAPNPSVSGRLYWSKFFAAQSEDVVYDVSSFDAWFTSVTRWVRKHGKKMHHGDTEPWCLPGALRILSHEL